jgi:hypothetical protein
MFECDADGGIFGKIHLFNGPVSFTLTASPDGEFLEITNGLVQGNANGVIPFKSDLDGKLDCSTNEIHASTTDGTAMILIFGANFIGVLDGHLDRLTNTITGTWTLAPTLVNMGAPGTLGDGGAPLVHCTGTWSATRQ